LWEAQGKSIEVTLSELNSEGGGWLLPQDAPKVREVVQAMLLEMSERGASRDERAQNSQPCFSTTC
ncbi:MAG: hypothetical protein ACRD9R_23830, partial [Pyrinomonadaceae bacterium]